MADTGAGIGHADSVASNESGVKAPEKKKSRRPASECDAAPKDPWKPSQGIWPT